jgi:hypothetical protein
LDENTEIYSCNKEGKFIKIKVKDLNKNFYVASYNFEHKTVEKKKAKKFLIGEKDCYEIELEDGRKIITTEDHRLFDSNNKKIFVGDLKINDKIFSFSQNEFKTFRISESVKNLWKNKEYRENQVSKHIGKKGDKDSLKKSSDSLKINWFKQTKEQKIKRGKKISKSLKGRDWNSKYGKDKADKLRKNLANLKKGRLLSQETKQKISKANKGNKKLSNSLNKYFRDVGISEKTRKKLSEAGKGKKFPKEKYPNCGYRGKNHKLSYAQKRIISKYMKKNNPMFNMNSRNKMANSIKKKWKDGKLKENFLNAQKKRPNEKEKLMIKLFKKLMIKLQYVGDGKVWITGTNNCRYNPDFINKDKKLIVEFFGDYWHNIENRTERDKLRIQTYKIRGYTPLIVWEKELNNLHKLKSKLINFYNGIY